MPPRPRGHIVEFGTLPGLEDLAADELRELLGPETTVGRQGPGALRVELADLDLAERPRIAGVAHVVRHFDVPRPKALLGKEHADRLVHEVELVVGRRPGAFSGLRLSTAGASSPVMQRLASVLSDAAGLTVDPKDGDLVVRLFPEHGGWTAAVRLTPRPLSARPWHVTGFPGALESTVAAAMVRLSQPTANDVFIDPCCGSGTILVERALSGSARAIVGVDVDHKALGALTRNNEAAGSAVAAVRADAAHLPLRSGEVSVIAANPPWGHRMGTRDLTRLLYPAMLTEAARVIAPGGRFILLSHQVRWTQEVLAQDRGWRIETERRVTLRGHHPRIWVLSRS